jgi:carbamoyl-phosphate synthase large subunit
MNCFRQSLAELELRGRITAVDATPYCAAGHSADAFYLVPRCNDPAFLSEIQRICAREEIHLIVPTIDSELPVFAGAQDCFQKNGTRVAISSPETVAICQDKTLTHQWMVDHGIPVPRQVKPEIVLNDPAQWSLPLIVKPIDGSASIGVRVIQSFDELAAVVLNSRNLIVQELVNGAEHTINVFMNSHGRCLCAVPHCRIETRSGEVSKGVTVKNRHLMDLGTAIAEMLPGAFGPLNIQCFLTPAGDIKLIETNARFGGGYPLAHRSGTAMTRWLLEYILGREPEERFDDWEDGLTMLRYDESVFVSAAQLPNGEYAAVHRVRS